MSLDTKNKKITDSKKDGKDKDIGYLQAKNIFSYKPFADNDVLIISCTEKTSIMLLRNGVVLSWGEFGCTLGRKLGDSTNDSYTPMPVKFPTKIVDIACGNMHCLARGSNFKIYSWGSNSHGQLGLGQSFTVSQTSEKEEPNEIQAFNNIKIKQIFAAGNSSFAITEGANKVYGWGSNENSQLGLINTENSSSTKVSQPKIIDVVEASNKEMTIFLNRKGDKSFVAELQRPSSDLIRALESFKNKSLFYKEYELREELENLKLSEAALTKRINGINSKSSNAESDLIDDINSLILKYKEKINSLAMNIAKVDTSKNSEKIKSFDKQIEFHAKKEQEIKDQRKKIEKEESIVEIDLQKQKNTSNENNDEKRLTDKKIQISDNKERIVQVEELIERVNSELQIQKFNTLNEHLKFQEEIKKTETKRKNYNELLSVFEKVKDEATKMMEKKSENNSKKDTESTMKKIEQEQKNFEINTLKNIESILPDNDSLVDSINKSTENLNDLEKKIVILTQKVDDKNKSGNTGQKILENFEKNIALAKQNNNLTEKIIEFSKLYYNSSLEKLIRTDNPPNFNDIKAKIDEYKKNVKDKIIGSDDDEEEDDEENSKN